MKSEINLEDLIEKHCYICKDDSNDIHSSMTSVKDLLFNFGRQLLELAVENAELYCEDKSVNIKYTTNFEKNGNLVISIDKKSILDTINQVE